MPNPAEAKPTPLPGKLIISASKKLLEDVGSGKIDFRTIFAQSDKAGIKHYFVEHDQPANPIATITNSANYLHALTF